VVLPLNGYQEVFELILSMREYNFFKQAQHYFYILEGVSGRVVIKFCVK